jgi:cell division protein FtsI (penicillin-binding protein 3)
MLSSAGFGSLPRSGFPGEVSGRLRAYQQWKPIEQATMSYGHGISVSLLQLARSYTVFTNDGQLLPLTFLRRDQPPQGERVMSARTARTVRAMLETVTQPGGTALQAQVTGYRVAGKTGTAHKAIAGTYAPDRYISSFVGFAPASDPRLIVAVMLDEPSGRHYYGGEVAAPVFSRIMAGSLRLLGIAPDSDPVLPPSQTASLGQEKA